MYLFSNFNSYEMINKILMCAKAASDMFQQAGFQRLKQKPRSHV